MAIRKVVVHYIPAKREPMSIQELQEQYKVDIRIVPEYYKTGTNWNWQILWMNEEGEEEGTYWYGDNGEHPTKESAEKAIEQYLQLLDKEEHAEVDKDPYRSRKGSFAHQQYCISIYDTDKPE